MPIEFHPSADEEVLRIHRRYRRRSPRAATRFLAALDKAVEQIKANPDKWPKHILGTQFRRLYRFPYYVVYVRGADRIRILAVPHNRRRPTYWKRRV